MLSDYFTGEEIHDIHIVCSNNRTIQKLVDLFEGEAALDPGTHLRLQLGRLTLALANDIKTIVDADDNSTPLSTKIMTGKKDDKLFDQLMLAAEKLPKLLQGLEQLNRGGKPGKELIPSLGGPITRNSRE